MQCCKKSHEGKPANNSCINKLKHLIMMILCCLAPIGVLLILKFSGYEGVLSYLVFLLCPLMHIFMMRGMGHKNKELDNETTLK